MPTALAIQCVDVQTPNVPSISTRVVNGGGELADMVLILRAMRYRQHRPLRVPFQPLSSALRRRARNQGFSQRFLRPSIRRSKVAWLRLAMAMATASVTMNTVTPLSIPSGFSILWTPFAASMFSRYKP